MYLQVIKDLQDPCDRTHINYGQHTKHNLPQTPADVQMFDSQSLLTPLVSYLP